MAEERAQRRLAAILAADVVGYGRLMQTDEAGTLAALKDRRSKILQPMVAEHRGRVVKVMGDGVLVEFASAVNAVACAVELQEAMDAANAGLPEDSRIVLRVGVNLGDVMVEGSDLYGDEVNIAARLESLAEPGSVFISGKVRHEIANKLPLIFEDLGEQSLKNIAGPVKIYRLSATTPTTRAAAPAKTAGSPKPSIAVLPFVNMEPTQRHNAEWAVPSARLPHTFSASIAVLPFANLSSDAEQEYFCDGITEDIIVLLARYRWLMVIARGSSFAYKGHPADVRQIGAALGAHYLVEGSVRRLGHRVRIATQLVNAANGTHLWAEHYDRNLEDVFTLQDEIGRTIASAIEAELSDLEREIARRKDPGNFDAWDWHQRGLWHFYQFNNAGFAEAERMFVRAVAIEPSLGRAHAALGLVQVQDAFYGDPAMRQAMLDAAVSSGQRAVVCDAKDAACHFALGRAFSLRRAYSEAIAELELAIELNPSFAQAHFALGHTLLWAGRAREAIGLSDQAERLSPRDPHLWTFHHSRSQALFLLGDLKKAEEFGMKAIQQPNATYWPFATLAATLAMSGQLTKASAVAKELLRRKPDYSCRYARQDFFFWNECDEHDTVELYVQGLARAGVPA
jgi:TolB-like protein/class 3 adenylate cyclase